MDQDEMNHYEPSQLDLQCLQIQLFCRVWRFMAKYYSRVVRKPDFCICENKGADQLCGNRTTDQRLCFSYTVSKIPLLPKSKISSL